LNAKGRLMGGLFALVTQRPFCRHCEARSEATRQSRATSDGRLIASSLRSSQLQPGEPGWNFDKKTQSFNFALQNFLAAMRRKL
jgi:hypothetical protein